jgi:hypothetical protein
MVPVAIILKQPDFGTAVIFIPILFTMLFVGGADVLASDINHPDRGHSAPGSYDPHLP